MNDNEKNNKDSIIDIDNSLFGEYMESYNNVIKKLGGTEKIITALGKVSILLTKLLIANFIISIGIIVAIIILHI